MVLARVWSVALFGVDGIPVEIEADLGGGKPGTRIVGLPDAALNEAKDRVRAAVRNSAQKWPDQLVTFNLSPAALPKGGSGYDLALAVSVLVADHKIPPAPFTDTVLLGELALDGRLRASRGVLPCLLAARRAGLRRAIVPERALPEASLVHDLTILGARTLTDVLTWSHGDDDALIVPERELRRPKVDPPDLADVVGQPEARWGLEVAAAGGHHVLLAGPPGTGKTMLAKRLPGLLPVLSPEQALEVTAIHSVVGDLRSDSPLITVPPFVAPHHSSSQAALVGGGFGLARPGLVSKAHAGVLFLDEAAEFPADRLDSLRTALEEGEIRLARRDGVVTYPARFQLVLATNVCPCAPPREADCVCSPNARRRYLARLSGPLLDRVDIRLRMRPITAMSRMGDTEPESTAAVAARVAEARERAVCRWAGRWHTNAEVPGPALRRDFVLPRQVTALLDRALNVGALTARGADRSLRMAWTLADLAGDPRPSADHVATALQFRDRRAA
ncbi:YifB family Mg chelatase-like AAA ATPase [Actinokineospora enzanensis]|uniref:YifB family Mg chelatase-like AAA ATPase n=1 Tax=Actinokineospora enzanensis TaxID=155975 RepID=UPI0003743F61|nr:YifB family Mg chelatase-like AAA ATPase [Actinokineospora enzanensis]